MIKELSFTDTKIKNIDEILKVNFYPNFLLTQTMGKQMNKKNGEE